MVSLWCPAADADGGPAQCRHDLAHLHPRLSSARMNTFPSKRPQPLPLTGKLVPTLVLGGRLVMVRKGDGGAADRDPTSGCGWAARQQPVRAGDAVIAHQRVLVDVEAPGDGEDRVAPDDGVMSPFRGPWA